MFRGDSGARFACWRAVLSCGRCWKPSSSSPPLPVCCSPSPLQEASRFNNLVTVLRRSLAELARALKGLAVMSAELEAMSTALLHNQVRWARC